MPRHAKRNAGVARRPLRRNGSTSTERERERERSAAIKPNQAHQSQSDSLVVAFKSIKTLQKADRVDKADHPSRNGSIFFLLCFAVDRGRIDSSPISGRHCAAARRFLIGLARGCGGVFSGLVAGFRRIGQAFAVHWHRQHRRMAGSKNGTGSKYKKKGRPPGEATRKPARRGGPLHSSSGRAPPRSRAAFHQRGRWTPRWTPGKPRGLGPAPRWGHRVFLREGGGQWTPMWTPMWTPVWTPRP